MSKAAKILELLKGVTPQKQEVYSAIVSTVDEMAGTMEVMLDDDDTEFLVPVLLRADDDGLKGIVPIPTKGSEVVITTVDGGLPFVLVRASKLDKVLIDVPKVEITCPDVQINGGKNNGLIIIEKLKDELGLYNELLKALLTVINSAPIPEPGNSSPSALQAALQGALAGKLLPTFTAIENKKVNH